jgi:hypothetical protein
MLGAQQKSPVFDRGSLIQNKQPVNLTQVYEHESPGLGGYMMMSMMVGMSKQAIHVGGQYTSRA